MMKSILSLTIALVVSTPAFADTVLSIYTDRPTARVLRATEDFARENNVEIQVVEKPFSELLNRLIGEGQKSPADIVFTKDLVYLNDLKSKNLLQIMDSAALKSRLESSMVDSDDQWVAVTYRARTAVYNPDMVDPAQLSTYEDLASEKWKGTLCLRTSKGSYNEALSAYLVTHYGKDKARNILKGLVDNLATQPFPNDTALIEAVANGVCHVGIINTYYLGMEKAKNPHLPAEVFFLNQQDGGVHTNGSGMGILKTASDKALAQKLVEHFLSDKVQQELADSHFEFPASTAVKPTTLVKDWMPFGVSHLLWSEIGLNVSTAKELIKEVGYP